MYRKKSTAELAKIAERVKGKSPHPLQNSNMRTLQAILNDMQARARTERCPMNPKLPDNP